MNKKRLVLTVIAIVLVASCIFVSLKNKHAAELQHQESMSTFLRCVQQLEQRTERCLTEHPETSETAWTQLGICFINPLDEALYAVMNADDDFSRLAKRDIRIVWDYIAFVDVLRMQPAETRYKCLNSILSACQEFSDSIVQNGNHIDPESFLTGFSAFASELFIPEQTA